MVTRGTTAPEEKTEHAGTDDASAAQGPIVSAAFEQAVTTEGVATHFQPTPGQSAMIQGWLCRPEQTPQRIEIDDAPELILDDNNFVWIDLADDTPSDLQAVARALKLHPTSVHATLSPWKRPHLDTHSDQFFVTATIPELDFQAYQIHARELDVFVGHNFLVSAHKATLPFADDVLTRAHQSPELLDQDSAFLLYIILDELLSYYESIYEQIQDAIENLEERALRETSNSYLKELQQFKRFAFAASRLSAHHHPIFVAFLRPDFRWVTGEGVEGYFRDLDSRFADMNEAMLSTKDSLNGAFDLYVSHVSHRTNQVMKLLTIVSTVLLPITVIIGFFGTDNLRAIPLLVQPAGFVLMLVLILVVSGSILLVFSRKGWLR